MTGWDKGVDYEAMMRRLERDLRRDQDSRRRCYRAIAIVQLRNGLRAIEAVRAFKHFQRTRQVEFDVPVAKKKRREERLVVIPPILYNIRCMDFLEVPDEKLKERYRQFLLYHYRLNTHSLRYAFITFLLRNGVSPSIVAKITRHSKLDYILRYTQEKEAEKTLKSLL